MLYHKVSELRYKVSLICIVSLTGVVCYSIYSGTLNQEKKQNFIENRLNASTSRKFLIIDNAYFHRSENVRVVLGLKNFI